MSPGSELDSSLLHPDGADTDAVSVGDAGSTPRRHDGPSSASPGLRTPASSSSKHGRVTQQLRAAMESYKAEVAAAKLREHQVHEEVLRLQSILRASAGAGSGGEGGAVEPDGGAAVRGGEPDGAATSAASEKEASATVAARLAYAALSKLESFSSPTPRSDGDAARCVQLEDFGVVLAIVCLHVMCVRACRVHVLLLYVLLW